MVSCSKCAERVLNTETIIKSVFLYRGHVCVIIYHSNHILRHEEWLCGYFSVNLTTAEADIIYHNNTHIFTFGNVLGCLSDDLVFLGIDSNRYLPSVEEYQADLKKLVDDWENGLFTLEREATG